MSEAMKQDEHRNIIPLRPISGEVFGVSGNLLPITDTSLDNEQMSERLSDEIDQKDLVRLGTRDERARYFVNTSLIVAGATYHFADLKAKDRQDAVQTLAITKMVSEAERYLANVEAQDGMKQLNEELYSIYENFEQTNIIRALTQLEKRYRTKFPAELVQAKRIALLALARSQPE